MKLIQIIKLSGYVIEHFCTSFGYTQSILKSTDCFFKAKRLLKFLSSISKVMSNKQKQLTNEIKKVQIEVFVPYFYSVVNINNLT
jgi:hypothetical protein